MNFSELNLHPDLQKGLDEAGYITCMPVQEQVLARAFSGQDLYVQSQTGTGKTAAFLVAIFQRLLTEDMLHGKKAIIMVPTRELAVQVEDEVKVIGKYLPFKAGSFFGGVGYAQQTALLRGNVQILVGTPGRVLDLNSSGQMNLMDVAFLVLDEADRMFDMGFYPDLRKLISAVPPVDRRQTMLFSATLNAWVKNLAWEYTRNPFEIAIEPETVTVEEIEQLLYHVSSSDKMKLLLGILKRENPESAIIFCNTKRYSEIVAKRLQHNGYDCEFIMGDLPQHKRLRVIDDIKSGKSRFLVATDVAARGLDIEGLAVVINYDLPNESENYVHRIGRTARAGKTGKAFTLATEQDVYELPAIERYLGKKIPSETASEELFAQDLSEGKRIQTEYYENRDRDRDRDRDSGSRGGRDREPRVKDRDRRERGARGRGRRPEERRGGEQRERNGTNAGRHTGAKSFQPPFDAKRDAAVRTSSARSANEESPPNLSELSMEERMAYYKSKYNKSEKSDSAENRREKPNGKKRRKGRTKHGGSAQENLRRKGNPEAGSKNEKSRVKTSPDSGSPPSEGKKGFLSRILGIFKKQ